MSDRYIRRNGSVFKIIPLFLGMTAIAVLSLMYMYYMKDMDLREHASMITREYMLKMETSGYLTREDEQLLIEELEQLGMDNINLAGTTMQQADYGQRIMLVIKARAPVSGFDIANLFDVRRRQNMTSFNIVRCTTAKN